MKKNLTLNLGVIVTLSLLMFWQGCEFQEPASIGENQIMNLKKSVHFQVKYSEHASVFGLQPPAGLPPINNDDLQLIDYQLRTVRMEIDDAGYIQWDVEHIEGNEDIRMPLSVWNATKNVRPSISPERNSVNRIGYSHGELQRIGEKGIVASASLDAEQFRIDPGDLDKLYINGCDTCSHLVAPRMEKMRENGINFTMIDDYHAKIEIHPDDGIIGKVTEVMDLRSGLPRKIAYYLKDNRLHSYEFIQYQIVNDYPVESEVTRFDFGDLNGRWLAITMTRINRNNISVVRNG